MTVADHETPTPRKACCTPGGRDPGGVLPASIGSGQALIENPAHAAAGSIEGMLRLEGGTFLMGGEDADGWPADGEGPVREVALRPFYMDATTVTNRQFERFVEATGFRTEAEPYGWSYVFAGQLTKSRRRKLRNGRAVEGLPWWVAVDGACWRKPEGSGSNIKKRPDHPVAHVSWNDAVAYARWAGKRLATEAEWEYAARGGLVGKRYAWGNELTPGGRHRCNIWQGEFPVRNTAEDGYAWTAPARSFPPNGFGFYNMAGNVWEWCGDWFSPDWHVPATSETRENPRGPGFGAAKVMRGGSFLCHASYCNRYRVAARTANAPDSSTTNCGFRCVRDIEPGIGR